MKLKSFAIALCLLPGLAVAGERWECTMGSEILIVAIVHDTKTTGQIEVAGTSQRADYEVEGFDRVWRFGGSDADGHHNYGFSIQPSGIASYYDFSNIKVGEEVSPSGVYLCEQTEEERLKQLDARRAAEADQKKQALAEADLQRQMADETAEFKASQVAAQGDRYYAAIQSQVTNNWFRPPTARSGLRCRLKIIQIPGGEVISAAISGKCNADEDTRRSLVAAFERAGSLPYRGFEDVFEHEIDFIFTYDEN